MVHQPAVVTGRQVLDKVVRALRARVGIARLQAMHPAIDRAVRVARRRLYTARFFAAGPRKHGQPGGSTFLVFNHSYDLDIDALCAANTPHTLWVLDAFALFTDVHLFFPPEQRDLDTAYGEGAMRESIARIKAAYLDPLARRLVEQLHVDALITPADTFYYLRPLIEALAARGVPTIVQDKEGTIAPSPIMDEPARVLAERYPPIGDEFFFWNDSVRDFWLRVGLAPDRMRVLGQPRSDFFFHPDRWPSKATLGLTEHKQLLVVFTYDSDVYLRVTEPLPDRPWKRMRDELHAEVRRVARERMDLEVVIKAHPQQADFDEVVAEFAADPLPNVTVIGGAKSASHLIVRADVIVGFQSTVTIEAMLTKTPVIYGGWGPVHAKHAPNLLPIDRSGGAILPADGADFAKLLRDALEGKLVPDRVALAARKQFTDLYFFAADGEVSARVLDAAAQVATRGSSSRRRS
jgi:hypothetical protein